MKTTHLLSSVLLIILTSACNAPKSEKIENKAEQTFQSIDIRNLQDNAVSLFGDNWFVVTAGNENDFNQMTISWGALGVVWGQPSATIYIRNTRHTYPYLNNNKYFTLCAFDEEHRDKVLFIGSNSGRDIDKIEATGLTPVSTELGNIYYAEARLVIECEKVYFDEIVPENILIEEGRKMYEGNNDTHRMFIGKIVNVWEKK